MTTLCIKPHLILSLLFLFNLSGQIPIPFFLSNLSRTIIPHHTNSGRRIFLISPILCRCSPHGPPCSYKPICLRARRSWSHVGWRLTGITLRRQWLKIRLRRPTSQKEVSLKLNFISLFWKKIILNFNLTDFVLFGDFSFGLWYIQ